MLKYNTNHGGKLLSYLALDRTETGCVNEAMAAADAFVL